MLRRFHLILAALAMLVAPLATQSGVAMAAMPMDHRAMAQAGHCGDEGSGDEEPGAMTQCCAAMCSAVAPLGATSLETVMYHAPTLYGLRSTEHRAFLAKLPTPPPRLA